MSCNKHAVKTAAPVLPTDTPLNNVSGVGMSLDQYTLNVVNLFVTDIL